MDLIDLHVHTNASDGTFFPPEVVRLAQEKGLKAIAITDHDTIEGNEEAIKEGVKRGFEVIPGVEISCNHTTGEVHLLGYFVDLESETLKRRLALLRSYREERNPEIIRRLRTMGLDITYEEVREVAGRGSIGRPHIAQVLKEKGYVFSNQDAFERYLKKGAPAYVPKELLPIEEAIGLIKEAGGIPIVAHPMQNRSIPLYGVERFIRELVEAGVEGVEVYYSTHSREDTATLLSIAKKYGLIVTGGTDFHGEIKPGIELGRGMGDMRIPYTILKGLKERWSS